MILVFPAVKELENSAAEIFVASARRAVRERGSFAAALSGGSSPRGVFRLLARPGFSRRVPWRKTHVFWVDERLVPLSSPQSNAGLAERLLLRHVPIPPNQVHPVPVGLQPHRAAAEYEAELSRFFGGKAPRFDLIFLGLGENGHTASVFPRSQALAEKKRWVVPLVRRGEGFHRLTMTPPVLSRGRDVVFIVYGPEKAAALSRTLSRSRRQPASFPAQLIRPAPPGRVLWLVDRKAASVLGSCELTSGIQ